MNCIELNEEFKADGLIYLFLLTVTLWTECGFFPFTNYVSLSDEVFFIKQLIRTIQKYMPNYLDNTGHMRNMFSSSISWLDIPRHISAANIYTYIIKILLQPIIVLVLYCICSSNNFKKLFKKIISKHISL